MANIVTVEQLYNKSQDSALDNVKIEGEPLKPSSDVVNKAFKLRGNRSGLGLNTKRLGVNAEDYQPYFDNSDLTVSAESDIDEQRARLQSAGEQLRNGLGKMGVLAATTFADNTVGLVAGLGNLAFGEDHDFIDNPFSRWLQDITKKSEEWMPNYYTKEGSESFTGIIPGTEGSANFWGDKVLKNMGFTIGAVAAGALTGSALSSIPKFGTKALARTFAKGLAGAEGKTFEEAMQLIKSGAIDATKLTDDLVKSAAKLKYANIGTQLGGATMGSIGESRIEALNASDEFVKNETSKAQQLLQSGQISPEEYQSKLSEIDEKKDGVQNMIFAGNMAILIASNMFQFKDAFTGGFKLNNSISKKVGNLIKKEGDQFVTDLPTSKIGKSLDFGKKLGKGLANAGVEGNEEQMQQVISTGSESFYGRQMDPKAGSTADDFVNSFIDGMKEGYATKEGWEQFFIGAFTGVMGTPTFGGKHGITWAGGVVGDLKEEFGKEKIAKDLVPQLNAGLKNIKDNYAGFVRHLSLEEQKNKALENDNILDYKNAEHDQFINTVLTFAKADKLGDLMDQLDGMKNTDSQEVRDLFAIKTDKDGKPLEKPIDLFADKLTAEDLKKKIVERSNKLKKTAERIVSLKDAIDTRFANQPEKVREELLQYASTIDNVDDRIKDLTNTLSSNGIVIDQNKLYTEEVADEVNNAAKAVEESKSINPIDKEEMLKTIKDLKPLVKRRNEFVDKYAKATGSVEGTEALNKKLDKEENKVVASINSDFFKAHDEKIVKDKEGKLFKFIFNEESGEREFHPVDVYGNPIKGSDPITHLPDTMSIEDFKNGFEIVEPAKRPTTASPWSTEEVEKGEETHTITEKPVAELEILNETATVKTEEESTTFYASDFPETQSNTRTEVTKKLLDFIAETLNIPKYDGDINSGSYIKWLHDSGELGYNVSQLLNAPRKAFELIGDYALKIKESSNEVQQDITTEVEDISSVKKSKKAKRRVDQSAKRDENSLFTRLAGSQTSSELLGEVEYQNGKIAEVWSSNPDEDTQRYYNWVTNTNVTENNYEGKIVSGQELFGNNWESKKQKIADDILADAAKEIDRDDLLNQLDNALFVVITKDGKYVSKDGVTDKLDSSNVIYTSFPNPSLYTLGGHAKANSKVSKEEADKALNDFKQIHKEIADRKSQGKVVTIDITGKSTGMFNYGYQTNNVMVAVDGHEISLVVNTMGKVVNFPESNTTHIFKDEDDFKGRVVARDTVTDNTFVLTRNKLDDSVKTTLKQLFKVYVAQKVGRKSDSNLYNSKGEPVGINIYQVLQFYLGGRGKQSFEQKDEEASWGFHKLKVSDTEYYDAMIFKVNGKWQEVKVNRVYADGTVVLQPEFEAFFSEWLDEQYHTINSSKLKKDQNKSGNEQGVRIVTSIDPKTNVATVNEQYNRYRGYHDYLLNKENPVLLLETNKAHQELVSKDPILSNSMILNQNLTYSYARQEVPEVTSDNNEVDDDLMNRPAKGKVLTEEDSNKMRKWFNKRFPNVDYNVVKGLIDGRNWGQFRKAAVYVMENTEIGTTFHEAWHVVTHLYLSREEINDLYKDYAKANGLAEEEWITKEGKLTVAGRKIEEALAEEFMNWQLGKPITSFKSPKQRSIFRRLLDFIKFIRGIKQSQLEEIFRKIDSGYYANKPQLLTIKSKSSRVNPEMGLTEVQAAQLNRSLTSLVMSYLFNPKFPERVRSLFDKSDNKEVLDGAYAFAKEYIQGLVDKGVETSDVLEHILQDKVFELARKAHADYLFTELNLQVTEDQNDLEQTSNDKMQLRSESGIKRSVKDSTTNNIKLLISSLPSLRRAEDGSRKFIYNGLGLPETCNFGEIFSVLGNKLAGSDSLNMMEKRMSELSKEHPAIEILMSRLKILNGINVDSTTIQTQMEFFQTFSRNFYEYWMDLIGKENDNVIFNSSQNSIEKRTEDNWTSNIARIAKGNPLYIEPKDDDELLKYNGAEFRSKYGVITKDNVFDFLKDIGVEYTYPGKVNNLLTNAKELSKLVETAGQIYTQIVKAKHGFPILFDELVDAKIVKMKGNIKYLLSLEGRTNTDYVENSHIDINGEPKFNLGYNSYQTLIVNAFNNSDNRGQFIAKLPFLNAENAAYLSNSLMLKLDGVLLDKDGNKKVSKISYGFHEGSKNVTKFGSNTATEFVDLKPADKLRIRINNFLLEKGFFVLRPGDNDLERTVKFDKDLIGKDQIYNEDNGKKYFNVFWNYLLDELNRSAEVFHSDVEIVNRNRQAFSGIFLSLVKSKGKGILNDNVVKLIETLKQTTSVEEAKSLVIEFAENSKNKFLFQQGIENLMEKETNKLLEEIKSNALISLSEDRTFVSLGLALSEDELSNEATLKQSLLHYIINEKAWIVEQTKIFTGDPIQFKSLEDQFKRHTSLVSTKRTVNDDYTTRKWMDINMPRVDGRTHDETDYMGHGTITTASFTDPKSKARALDSLKRILGRKAEAYGKYNKADAQGIITLDEYRSILFKSGQWSFGKDSLEELYQWEMQPKGKHLNPVYRNPDGTVSHIIEKKPKLKFKPQKLQYFGALAEDGYTNIIFKLSVYPLTPSLCAQSKELDRLRADLESQKIGIVTFESGNKIGYKTKDGKANDLNDSSNLITQNTYSKFWGIQVDSTPKVKSKVVSGTQMMKQVISNLAASGRVTNERMNQLIETYKRLNTERIEIGKTKLRNKLGVKQVGENYVVEDIKKFKDFLLEEAKKRNMADNTLDGLELMTSNNGIDTLVNREQVENVLFSLADNYVVSQKRFGGSAVQAASVLIDEELGFYEEDMLQTKAAQIKIASFLKEFPHLTVAQLKEIDPRLVQIIGFRIPTQAMSSIDAVEIKDFLPDTMSDMAVMPEEIVAKQGGDFDFDKFNMYFPNYYSSKGKPVYIEYGTESEMLAGYEKYKAERFKTDKQLEEEDFINRMKGLGIGDEDDTAEMTFDEYKSKAIENKLSETQREILLDPSNIKSLLSPVDSQNLTSAAAYVTWVTQGKPKYDDTLEDWYDAFLDGKPLYNILNSEFVTNIGYRFQSGSAAIGIGALYSTFLIACQHHGVTLENTTINLPHNGTSTGVNLGGESSVSGLNIADLFNEWLTVFVDAPKEPHMANMGISMQNVNTALYLTQAGVDPTVIGLFMQQPIIREYLKAQEVNESKSAKENGIETSKNKLLKEVRESFTYKRLEKKSLSSNTHKSYKKQTFTADDLAEMINSKSVSEEYVAKQLQILNDFITYQQMSKEVGKAMQAINVDTNGAGKNVSEMLLKTYLIEKLSVADAYPKKPEPIKDKKGNIVGEKKFPYIKGFTDIIGSTVDQGYNVTPDDAKQSFLSPYYRAINELKDIYAPFVRILRDPQMLIELDKWIDLLTEEAVSKDGIIKVMDLFKKDLFSYLVTTTKFTVDGVEFDIQNERNRLFYGKDNITVRLIELKKKFPGNILLKRMYPITPKRRNYYGSTERQAYGINFYYSKSEKLEQNALVEAWEELMDEANFGYDLIKVAIAQTGLQTSNMSFWHLIPAPVFNKILTQVLLQDDMKINQTDPYRSNYIDQFQLNNTGEENVTKHGNTKGRRYYIKDKEVEGKIIKSPVANMVQKIGESIIEVPKLFVAIIDWKSRQSLKKWFDHSAGFGKESPAEESDELIDSGEPTVPYSEEDIPDEANLEDSGIPYFDNSISVNTSIFKSEENVVSSQPERIQIKDNQPEQLSMDLGMSVGEFSKTLSKEGRAKLREIINNQEVIFKCK